MFFGIKVSCVTMLYSLEENDRKIILITITAVLPIKEQQLTVQLYLKGKKIKVWVLVIALLT